MRGRPPCGTISPCRHEADTVNGRKPHFYPAGESMPHFLRTPLYPCVSHLGMFCGPCYENRRKRSNHKGHLHYQPPKLQTLPYQGELMKRNTPVSSKPAKGKWSCPDPEFHKKFPSLSAYLCDVWYDDGEAREVSSLTVRMGEGVTLALSDPDQSQSCFTTSTSLAEAFQAMESALSSGAIRWHRWKKFKKG